MTPPQFARRVLSLAIGQCLISVGVGTAAPVLKPPELAEPFVKWAMKAEFVGDEPHEPVVVKDRVIVGTDGGELRAYQCSDGKLIWIHNHGKRIYHRPCSDGKKIYFTSVKGVTAVTVDDGSVEWSFDNAACDGPSLVLGEKGLVYVGGHDGKLYALDAKTGEKKWDSDFVADSPADPPDFPGERARMNNTLARPTAIGSDGETLYLSVMDQSRIVAIDAKTGKRQWSYQTGGWIGSTATATAKHVFIGSQDQHLHCLDKRTGKQVWKFETKSRVESGGVVDEKYIYFGSCDGYLYCLNQSDGKERWKFATDLKDDGRKSPIYSVPVLRPGSVFFAAGEGQFYAVDRTTGKLKGKVRPSQGSTMYCSPATDGTHFFVTTRPGQQNRGEASLVGIGLK